MPTSALTDVPVRELQRLAGETDIHRQRNRAKTASRAARLQLIDKLSRWGATGLAAIAGAAVYSAVRTGQIYPARAAAWALMVLAAIWICRKMRAQFRAGEEISARPFRWRAQYTSCLSVLGFAFGSGAILLLPSDASQALALQIVAITFLSVLIAGVAHAPHAAAAAAIVAPGIGFGIAALAKHNVDGLALYGAAALAIMVAGCVALTSVALRHDARRRNPRTTFVRTEVAPAAAPNSDRLPSAKPGKANYSISQA